MKTVDLVPEIFKMRCFPFVLVDLLVVESSKNQEKWQENANPINHYKINEKNYYFEKKYYSKNDKT